MTIASSRIEYTQKEDPFLDFCLWDYTPLLPIENKYRSNSLLYHSFEVAGVSKKMYEVCEIIRNGMGPFNTVWGIKCVNDVMSWEFYFYDYRRTERERSISRFFDCTHEHIHCGLKYPENRPYFMFSVDIDDDLMCGKRDLSELNIYIGNIGSNVSSGICYSLTKTGLTLDNFYFFFDSGYEMADIVGKVCSSAHLGKSDIDIDEILWPEMIICKTIVIANKKHNEGVYFSRINIDQLIKFMKRTNMPCSLLSFTQQNRLNLDHLRYDVGYDYILQDDGIRVLKSACYGIL